MEPSPPPQHADPLQFLISRLPANRVGALAALLTATLAHGALAWQLPHGNRTRMDVRHPTPPVVVDVETPPPEPPAVEDRAVAASQNTPVRASAPRAAATPMRAQAAAVLTRSSDANEPVDMTDGFVVGDATTYAGGTTMAQGTSSIAVREVTQGKLQPGHASPRGSAQISDGAPDRARRASMLGGTAWTCPFPSEADADGVDHAVITVRLTIDANGSPTNAAVVRDAGRGFGREARRCALEKRFEPALDANGTPRAGAITINVHFDR